MSKIALAALLGIASFVGFDSERVTSDTERKPNSVYHENSTLDEVLSEFPRKINGASEVKIYRTKGARKCIVHTLQTHYGNPKKLKEKYGDKRLEEIFENVENVQRNNYSIISDLDKKGHLDSVYAEGIFLDYDREGLENFVYRRLRKLKNAEIVANDEERSFIVGGEALYSLDHGLKILPAEDLSLKRIMAKELKLYGKLSEELQEEREDHLLEKASKSKNPFIFVTYGAKHAFGGTESFRDYSMRGRYSVKDNLAEWNKKNPDKKFSLIEIYPKGLYN